MGRIRIRVARATTLAAAIAVIVVAATIPATNAVGTTYGADQTLATSAAVSTAPQGSWAGAYGADGYDLAAWNGRSDVVSMPGASVGLVQGNR